MSGYDIGASFAASSGAQGGTASIGDFIVGGSGGAGKVQIPWWVWAGLGVVIFVVVLKALFPARRK